MITQKYSKIKFSFVVPVYNVEKYLKRCLNSLLAQDYDNFEIICVNDGSTDNSGQILHEYAAQNPSIKVVEQENQGLGAARNTGVRYVTGDYIWFVDSDDWVESNSLILLRDYIGNHGLLDMVIFDSYQTTGFSDRNHVLKALWNRNIDSKKLDIDKYIKLLLCGQGLYSAWCRIYKTDIYKSNPFDFSKGFYEDISQFHLYMNNVKNIGYLKKTLYNYYYNSNSIMRQSDSRILDMFKQISHIGGLFEDNRNFKCEFSFFKVRGVVDTFNKINGNDSNLKTLFFQLISENPSLIEWSFWQAVDVPFKTKVRNLLSIVLIKTKMKFYA